ncbi:MAG: AAA family ATPase [Paracoccaceae bacterium]
MTDKGKSVLLISPDASVSAAVGMALAGMQGVKIKTEASTLAGLNGKAAHLAQGRDIIIFDTSDDEGADLDAIRALKAARQAGGLLLALADSGITLSRVHALNQAGVDEVLPRPVAGQEIGTRIQRLCDDAAVIKPSATKGRIIAVAQARGGVGATTVAVNLANDLVGIPGFMKKRTLSSVALVDLDVQFGSVGALLDLGEQNALHQMALDGTIPDAAFLSHVMSVLPNGMKVLAAPTKFMPLDSLQPQQIAAILDTLQHNNDFVVVDLPHALGSWMEPVLRRADELIIVSDTSVPSVRHCRRLIEFFTADNPELPVRIVINHETRSFFPTSAQKEVQKALDRKLDHWLPHDPRAARACADRGKPLASVAPRSQLGRAISRLARQTITEFAPPTPTRSR